MDLIGNEKPTLQSRLEWIIDKYDTRGQEIPPVWDELNARCRHTHPLLTASFAGALSRYFGSDNMYIAILRVGGMCAGVALLSRISRFHWEVFRPGQAPLGLILLDENLVDSSVAAHALLRALPGYAIQLDVFCIDPLHISSDINASTMERTRHVETMSIRKTRSFDEYVAERPKSLRKNLRRYERRRLDEGKTQFVQCIHSVEGMDRAVEEHGELEASGWKGAAGTAITKGTEQGVFYAAVMRQEAERGRAIAIQLYFGEKLAASRLIVMGGGIAVILKTAYDEGLSRFAVGRINLKKTIETLFDRPDVEWIEFYTNASVDQLQWSTNSRFIEHRTLYRSAALRTAKGVYKKMRRCARRRPITVSS